MKLRIKSSDNQIKYQLLRPIKNLKYLFLSKAMIYNTAYLINENNNKITVDSTTINLTSGNYNSTELASHLQSVLSASFAGTTVSFNSSIFKFTITFTSSRTMRFDTAPQLAYILGFNYSSLSGTTLTSNYAANLSVNPYYIMKMKEINSNDQNKDLHYCNEVIYNNTTAGGILYYEKDPLDKSGVYIYPQNECKILGELNITIFDHKNNPIDFNQAEQIYEFNCGTWDNC